MHTENRRTFIKTLGAFVPLTVMGNSPEQDKKIRKHSFELGIASYSFRNYSLEETIAMTNSLGINNIALKSMHLPLDAEDSQLKSLAAMVRAAGIGLYGAGVIYMNSEKEVENAFKYARIAELTTIIGVPKYEHLPHVEKLVKDTGIQLAIHNHGPGDKVYPSPESIFKKIKNLDPRIGICLDIGHTQRIGLNPAKEMEKYFNRILDIHMKDVSESTEEGESTIIGRGVIDIPEFLTVLIENEYNGKVSFEYEKDPSDILPGFSESVGYVKGVLATLNIKK